MRLFQTYGGAALVTGSLMCWHGELADRTAEGLSTALALSVGGVALLLLAHAGTVATRRKALLFVSKEHDVRKGGRQSLTLECVAVRSGIVGNSVGHAWHDRVAGVEKHALRRLR